MPDFNLTFEQYNRDQELLTKRYQNRLARNRDIIFGGITKVKKSEVQEKLEKLGIDIHWDTVLNWERAGLLPKSKMIGREKDFPEDYCFEVYATYQLKKGKMRLTNDVVKAARDIALEEEPEKIWLKALEEKHRSFIEGTIDIDTIIMDAAYLWNQEKIKSNPDCGKWIDNWLSHSKEGQDYQILMKRLKEIGKKNIDKTS